MKRFVPVLAFATGVLAIYLLMPLFKSGQPTGIRLTRKDAVQRADAAARAVGIPVDQSWAALTFGQSAMLDTQLESDPELRRRGALDPVVGPRLGFYRRTYYHKGLEKTQPYGYVLIDRTTGETLGARLMLRTEEHGAKPAETELRPKADAFVKSHSLRGAPSPAYESAKPNALRGRTDYTFRYRVASNFPMGKVVPYLYVYFTGDKFAGWQLVEEYSDGSAFRGESGIATIISRYATFFALLLILLIIFLKKYHAGEVGIGTGSVLFACVVLIALGCNWLMGASAAEGSNTGGLDAQQTALVYMVFKFMLYDLVIAVLVFFAWAVGESYARERWGERLAAFDSLLRRDPLNATAGRSVLNGLLFGPAVAAAAFLSGAIPLALKLAHTTTGVGTDTELYLGGPVLVLLFSAMDAVIYPILMLFMLGATHRKRATWLGVLATVVVGMVGAVCDVPTDPFPIRLLFDFGGMAAVVAIFLGFDLLSAVVALFFGTLISMLAPLISVASGGLLTELNVIVIVPVVLTAAYAAAALLTRREVVYTYEDLAPHVKRIVERERVKAEIDAANRIQAALLPMQAPELSGASVASHYRAATEIGGDYFDFLPLNERQFGIAFGDVAGHGLTSGIVMAMAKAALLVQVRTDASPRSVMNVLNDIVLKTAPKRMMMTFFFGLLDPESHRLRFSSAGHLDPYVYRARDKRLEALSSWGFPLGVKRREPFREHDVAFAPGDRLILYSDGLIEAIDDDGDPFGFDRFERTLLEHGHESAEEMKKALLGSIRKFTRNRPPEDDQTLVIVSFEGVVTRMEPAAVAYAAGT
jgi:hypothetical protein